MAEEERLDRMTEEEFLGIRYLDRQIKVIEIKDRAMGHLETTRPEYFTRGYLYKLISHWKNGVDVASFDFFRTEESKLAPALTELSHHVRCTFIEVVFKQLEFATQPDQRGIASIDISRQEISSLPFGMTIKGLGEIFTFMQQELAESLVIGRNDGMIDLISALGGETTVSLFQLSPEMASKKRENKKDSDGETIYTFLTKIPGVNMQFRYAKEAREAALSLTVNPL